MAAVFGRLRRDDGQGLIELIVALTILAVGIGAVVTVLTASALSLERSDQKGTALTLAEKQIELYRNVTYADIRLAGSSWSSAPLTNAADPYFTASASDTSIPSGAKSGEITDTTTGLTPAPTACPTPLLPDHPECVPVQTVTGPDHRLYRIDTYVTKTTPTLDGSPTGTPVGNELRQVTVIVRNAQIPSLPILARNTSTFSDVNAASFGGKAVPYLQLVVPKAWATTPNGATIPASSIGVAVSNGLYPLTTGGRQGIITVYYTASPTPPTPGCGTGWSQVGKVPLDSGNVTYYLSGSGAPVVAGNTYWWYADFDGDSSDEKATSRCSPAMATTVVQSAKWTPSISISAPTSATTGVPVDGSKFTATLANSSPGANGFVHIRYGGPASSTPCPSGTQLGTDMTATGDGRYSQASPFPAATTGTYWWWATYDGDSNNQSASSCGVGTQPSTDVNTGATVSAPPQLLDSNHDGTVDQVLVTFSKTLNPCASPCTNGWTLSNPPGGATLSSVTVSGSTATLNLTGGSADTSAGTFTIKLDPSGDLLDSSLRHASVPAGTIVVDKANPVLMTAATTAGSTANRMQQGDTLDLTFSEAVNLPAGPFTVTESRSGGSTTLTIPGLIQTASIANGYLGGNPASGSATGTASLTNGGKTIHVVLGVVTTTGGGLGTGSGGTSITPAAGVTDAASNAAVTTVARTVGTLF
jgi:type II secretory pathway pseudopilin PulG